MFKYLNEAQTIWMKFYWKMRLRRIHNCEYLFLKWQIQTNFSTNNAQKMKFSIKDFFSKCGQIRRKVRSWLIYQINP